MTIYVRFSLLLILVCVFSCNKDSVKTSKKDPLDSTTKKDSSIGKKDILKTKTYVQEGYFLDFKNNDPTLDTSIREDLVKLFFQVYPKLVQRFNTVAPNKIVIKMDTSYSGRGKVTGDEIILNANSYSNTENIDNLTYQLGVLILKSYPHSNPTWLIGALPFYMRYSYGVPNDKDSWSLPGYKPNQNYHNDLVAARFLIWLENNIKEGVVDQLNNLLSKGKYSGTSMGDITGFSLNYLWSLYSNNPSLTNPQIDLSESIRTKHYSRKGINLTFKSNDLYLDTSIRRKLVNAFYSVYPEEKNRFNPQAPENVTILIDTSYSGIAYTQGTKVVFSAVFYHLHSDVDVLTHEAMHLTQSYPRYDPVWLVEGIADYARYKFGLHNLSANWTLPNYSPAQSYTDSYRVTARFLIWIEVNVNEEIVDKLDNALRSDTYSVNTWKEITGKNLDELWQEYGNNPELDLHYSK